MKRKIVIGGAVIATFVSIIAVGAFGSWILLLVVAPSSLPGYSAAALQELQVIPLGNPLNVIASTDREEESFQKYLILHNRSR